MGDTRLDNYIVAVEVVNKVAERAEGFVWKYEKQLDCGDSILVDDIPCIVVNLTVWQSLSSLRHFVWKTLCYEDLRTPWRVVHTLSRALNGSLGHPRK